MGISTSIPPPEVWETCAGSGVISLNTFSLSDLTGAANMTRRGYHIRQLITIADREYRIWPGQEESWKSNDEILHAILKIEAAGPSSRGFLRYDPVQDSIIYDLDSQMPFLAKELGYHYTIDNNVIS